MLKMPHLGGGWRKNQWTLLNLGNYTVISHLLSLLIISSLIVIVIHKHFALCSNRPSWISSWGHFSPCAATDTLGFQVVAISPPFQNSDSITDSQSAYYGDPSSLGNIPQLFGAKKIVKKICLPRGCNLFHKQMGYKLVKQFNLCSCFCF